MSASPRDEPSYRHVLEHAWPAILANAAVPLMGMVDTAIIGRVGGATDLGGVALSTLVFNSIYWALGFLRMSTTALVARAHGAGDAPLMWRIVARALTSSVLLGAGLIAVRHPLVASFLTLLGAGPEVNDRAREYILIRFWGAPAVLVHSAVCGGLIGLGFTRLLLNLQLVMNLVNVTCSSAFVWGLGGDYAGVRGIAAGSVAAEWVVAIVGLVTAGRASGAGEWRRLASDARLWLTDWTAWRSSWSVNTNIFVRTAALLLGFAWFTRSGTQLGASVLGGNHLLQQVISFSAFFLDGVAFVAESHVGRAIGARDWAWFRRAVWRTSVVALGFGAALALTVLLAGPFTLDHLAPSPAVRDAALAQLPLAALYVLVGVAPWQLDGIFIGAARGAALRNAALLSSAAFLVTATWWTRVGGNRGLWSAMIIYIALRGVALGLHWRSVTGLFPARSRTP